MRITITFHGEAGQSLTRWSTHGSDAAELLAVALERLPEFAAEADAEEARYAEQRRAEREAREAQRWWGLRRAHARAIIGGLLRDIGLVVIPADSNNPRSHAAIDRAAAALGLSVPERVPSWSRRSHSLVERWNSLLYAAVEHIEAGGQVLGLDLEGLDGLAEEHERCRGVEAF